MNRIPKEQSQHGSPKEQQKVLMVGQSKYNISQCLVRWVLPDADTDNREPTPHTGPTSAQIKTSDQGGTEGISEDILTQPLLDGGQGKKNVLPNVLTKPQGDVNAGGSTVKLQTKLQPTQTNWAGGQRLGKANINISQPYDLITDRGQQVPTQTQQPITTGAWTTNTKGAPTNIDGLLPPIIEATGNLVAGKDIEKLRLQNKRR
jgi:hypothetical protein